VVLVEGPESWRCSRLRLQDAWSELQTAYDMFADMGAAGFAERARIGLSHGARVRQRADRAATDPTPQEKQVATLVPAGHQSRGGRRAFTSPTVDYLRSLHQKLGVSSRTQMARNITTGTG
jgi:DNA-binding NarL/FixJ family response regulator